MIGFLVKRFVAGVLTVFAIATLCFVISRFAPGSPITSEKQVLPEVKKNLERYYGLDKPLHIQYFQTLAGYLRGDLGPSFTYRDRSVNDLVWPAFKVSIVLGVCSFVIAILIGVPIGVLAAARHNKLADHLSMSVAVGGICIPNFLLGPLLVLLFSFVLSWFDPAGWPQDWSSPAELKKLVLPAFTLAFVHIAYISRLTRAGMLDVMNKDYIRTARAKGLDERTVVLKHGLKNGITPVVSYIGPMAALIITGSIVVEKVFEIPGLGQHFVKAALNRDYGLVMGTVLVYSTLVIAFNLIVDLMYGWLDPRVRVQ
jgi:oligopeptide transport system permease protein